MIFGFGSISFGDEVYNLKQNIKAWYFLIDNINKGFIYFKHINKINNHYSPSIKNNDWLKEYK